MKKCSTATLMRLAAQTALQVLPGILPGMLLTPMPAQAAQGATVCEWASDAPDQHRVQRGDTLWAIASVFLKNPWCWPQVWENNRNHIRDPHWIYPGQLILLDRVHGVLRSGDPDRDGSQAIRVSPSAREQALERARVPVISDHLLRMLERIRLLDAQQLERAPLITGITEGRKLAAEGDTIVARGEVGNQRRFDVIRASLPIIDPDSRQVLGMVGRKIGSATLSARGTLSHRLMVTASNAELQAGDRLMPVSEAVSSPVSIHPSEAPAGKLAAILHEGRWAGTNDMVVVNRGAEHGLTGGSVVRVARQARIRADESMQSNHGPEESQSIALLLVLAVADRLSVAVVMRSRDTVTVGDIILPP